MFAYTEPSGSPYVSSSLIFQKVQMYEYLIQSKLYIILYITASHKEHRSRPLLRSTR